MFEPNCQSIAKRITKKKKIKDQQTLQSDTLYSPSLLYGGKEIAFIRTESHKGGSHVEYFLENTKNTEENTDLVRIVPPLDRKFLLARSLCFSFICFCHQTQAHIHTQIIQSIPVFEELETHESLRDATFT